MTLRLSIHGPDLQLPLGGGGGHVPSGPSGVGTGTTSLYWGGGRKIMGRPDLDFQNRRRPALVGADGLPLRDAEPEPEVRAGKGRGDRPDPPKWCRDFYRPRQLSGLGVQIMRDLDPQGAASTFPLGYGDPNQSLQARQEYLARRHTALDLMRKGEVFSVGGYYHHISRVKDTPKLLGEWYAGMPSGSPGVGREELLQWLGLFRRPSLEQVLAVAPGGMRDTWDELDRMATEGLLLLEHVQMGAGKLETVSLTKKGWKAMLDSHGDASVWGWGPRRALPQNREFHEQVVGDAVAYALHELTEMSAKPVGVLLDPALRRLYLGLPYIPDLRLDYEDRLGVPGHYLMEVEGRGSDYRGQRHMAKMNSAGLFRAFSVRGGTAQRGGGRVCIGR